MGINNVSNYHYLCKWMKQTKFQQIHFKMKHEKKNVIIFICFIFACFLASSLFKIKFFIRCTLLHTQMIFGHLLFSSIQMFYMEFAQCSHKNVLWALFHVFHLHICLLVVYRNNNWCNRFVLEQITDFFLLSSCTFFIKEKKKIFPLKKESLKH